MRRSAIKLPPWDGYQTTEQLATLFKMPRNVVSGRLGVGLKHGYYRSIKAYGQPRLYRYVNVAHIPQPTETHLLPKRSLILA